MATPRPAGLATAADLATSEHERVEILGGVIVEKAGPSYEHGDSQRALCSSLGPPFHRRGGGGPGAPSGWWIATEVEVLVVHRWTEAGYVVALTATAGETVRAEPFEAIEAVVGVLFGEEPAT